MPELIEIKTFKDERGSLGAIGEELPFSVKRVFYIYDVKAKRGGHRHVKSIQALICLNGSCKVYVQNNEEDFTFSLEDNKTCLILDHRDWHTMDDFSPGSVLLVLASEPYTAADYIYEPYK